MTCRKKKILPVVQTCVLYVGYVVANIIILVWGNVPHTTIESLYYANKMFSLYNLFLWMALFYTALCAYNTAWWKWICGGILFLAPGVLFNIYWYQQGNLLMINYGHPSFWIRWLIRYVLIGIVLFLAKQKILGAKDKE